MLENSVKVSTKNMPSQFIEGQSHHFGMPEGAKLSLTFNELLCNQIQKLPPECAASGTNLLILYAKQPPENRKLNSPRKVTLS
jgi:hypothetical protein